MNVLIVGSGARENAIAAAFHRSAKKPAIFCCGTSVNPGIKQMSRNYWVGDICDVETIANLAKEWQITLAIIGPEAPLEKGLADELWRNAIPTIGPRQQFARIETSKQFARDLMQKYRIPGLPRYRSFHSMEGVSAFLAELGKDGYVIKANGLMSGKGVKVAGDHLHSFDEAKAFCEEILTTQPAFVIEEKLVGQEFSFMAFCDGETLVPMPLVQDHKRALVGDKGPNTGGMGSYSDAEHGLPFLVDEDISTAWKINEAVMKALSAEVEGKYIGILYGGFIATAQGIYVIEFNARFGDPESLNVLSVLTSDFTTLCEAMVTGSLMPQMAEFAKKATVCKYAVPVGYPDGPVENTPIDIAAVKNKTYLYLSAVDAKDGTLYALGSRTAAYVGVADTITNAEQIAETEVSAIGGQLYHREDIGTERLIQQRVDAMRKLRS